MRWASLFSALVLALAWGTDTLASGHGAAADDSAHGAAGDEGSSPMSGGLDLGEYHIRSYYPVQAQKSILRFALYATVAPDRLAESRQLMAIRRHKVRDQVITATRMVPLSEFDEPELARFRRRILLSNFELKIESL
jgi:hypothetical protein